ncbi:hypothetical protein K505DRAFT_263185 [Melanomma pulvis-pyrius CBS 109.77]|uniref:Uncharacterized protein n=1 Tax=Melanomma pulvis-pyrius CBS 109.77 TaxID=1314802 RepID=A0A6A6XWE3_9PLEO|nr:hypothetical protein K505DRAFT_263185 [Melanomma pulvis-pyrius CBS 109.77]
MSSAGLPSGNNATEMAPPKLDTLPSELRKLIVSFLAPSGSERERYARYSKLPLKNANLAHACLREWVPEYMFRDMSLFHVSSDISSHLELFAICPANAGLVKYVKTVQVKVPPAIRWELNTDDPFDTIEDITEQRLVKKFNVKSPSQMSDSQRQYCSKYHRAMVHPFTDNRRWYSLLSLARDSWREIFLHFPNLERISVGVCERSDHPAPTYTNAFITRYGKNVVEEVEPAFREDSTVNPAWASSIVLSSAPPSVKSLRLSMANLDNLNSFATVNRLLSFGYYKSGYLLSRPLNYITQATLDLRGPKGTHGTRIWLGDTGSAGMVKYWRKVLISMQSLTDLEIRFDVHAKEVGFTDMAESDPKGCILDWLLSELELRRLTKLRFRYFLINRDSFAKIFASASNWSNLKVLVLEEIRLIMDAELESQDNRQEHLDHIQGEAWLSTCQVLSDTLPGIEIELNRPVSNINGQRDYKIHPKYVKKFQQLHNVRLDLSGSLRGVQALPPIEKFHTEVATREAITTDA